jgi:hypothetical protein
MEDRITNGKLYEAICAQPKSMHHFTTIMKDAKDKSIKASVLFRIGSAYLERELAKPEIGLR